MYLLHRAHVTHECEKAAQAQGDVFHASDTYYDLAPKVQAQLRIHDDMLVLIARHQEEEDVEEMLAHLAHVLLATDVQRVTPSYVKNGCRYHVFYTKQIPPPLMQKEPSVSR